MKSRFANVMQFDRHLYAGGFAVGSYISYLIKPEDQFAFTSKWVGILLLCTYLVSFISTFIKKHEGFLRTIVRTFVVYYINFYLFWLIVSLAFELSDKGLLLAIRGSIVTYLVGTPIVMFKLVPAAIVSIALQFGLKLFRKPSV